MFGIPTPAKILLILVVIGVLWWWHRRNQIRARERSDQLNRGNPAGRTRAKTKNSPAKPIEDMAQCRVCGAYVPAIGATRCGKDKCPF